MKCFTLGTHILFPSSSDSWFYFVLLCAPRLHHVDPPLSQKVYPKQEQDAEEFSLKRTLSTDVYI